MATSNRKTAANRGNGGKTHGPINTKSTRYNATKHSLLTHGVTELDEAEGYETLRRNLIKEKTPVGPIEEFLITTIAIEIVRLQRARRLEAEFITGLLNPPQRGSGLLGDNEEIFGAILDPGLPASVNSDNAQKLVGTFQRYESTFLARLFRTLHELERLQRMRKGEALPVPAAVDVIVHTDAKGIDAPAADLEQAEIRPGVVNASIHAVAEIVNPSSDLRQIEGRAPAADAGLLSDEKAAEDLRSPHAGRTEDLPVPQGGEE